MQEGRKEPHQAPSEFLPPLLRPPHHLPASPFVPPAAVIVNALRLCATWEVAGGMALGVISQDNLYMILRGRVRSGEGGCGYWIARWAPHCTAETVMKLGPGALSV